MPARRLAAPSLIAATALAVAAAPAAADSRASCTVQVPVRVAADGSFSGSAHNGSLCTGTLGGLTLATRPAPASITGTVRHGPTRCAPAVEGGRLTMHVPRLLNFGGDTESTVEAVWALGVPGTAGPVSGAGTVDSDGVALLGSIRFVTATTACWGGGFAPGVVELAFGVVDGPAPAEEPDPASRSDDAAAGRDRKAKPRRRCGRTAKAESRRAGDGRKKCRRAAKRRR